MSTPVAAELNLRQAEERLTQNVPLSPASRNPKKDAEVVLSAVAFLVHLQKDQATLRRWRSTSAAPTNGNDAAANNINEESFPPASEIPAISVVLHNERFFTALLRCLYSTQEVGNSSSGISTNDMPHGRKRTLSMSGNDAQLLPGNKALKASSSTSSTLSPMPGRKVLSVPAATAVTSFSWPVWAATILSTALHHLDHWPTPLVHAYAVDVFGARSWVDDADCQCLVQNLALVLDAPSDSGTTTLSEQQASDAAAVVEAYRTISRNPPSPTSSAPAIPENGGIRRLSSTSSVGRKSDDMASGIKAPEPIDGDSSSSGEEEEDDMDVFMSASNEDEESRKSHDRRPPDASSDKVLYPVPARHTRWTRIRARYVGVNLEAAYEVIGMALQDRVDQKSKQNSGLLQTLPMFTSIPIVRHLVTQNLEKWLQSPALAGLSRTLFTSTVEHMKNVDPPLPEDLQAINCILGMKLKANQFAAHVENVTAIAKKIPTATVANHMYATLLQQSIKDASLQQGPSEESLSMIAAIHKTVPPQISYEAIAYSILMLLVQGRRLEKQLEYQTKDPMKLIRRLRKLIRALASKLAPTFDGFQVLVAFLELETNEGTWSVRDEEDKARLMFQCVTLYVASVAGVKEPTKSPTLKVLGKAPGAEEKVREALRKSRKILLQWCCNEYGPRYSRRRNKKSDTDIFEGTASPDFVSAIGPDSQEECVPPWLNTMRCLLMIENVDSDLMNHFLSPPDDAAQQEAGWIEEKERIAFCANFGADVDDEMISVILRSASTEGAESGMSPDMSIKLLEHLFESCGRRQGALLKVSDPELVWEMYKLAHYTPSRDLISLRASEVEEDDSDYAKKLSSLPRLAYTGMWWRVTILGLVMCGSNPEQIGSVVWKDHPTISSLIKMVTSTKYRFPTVDCDDVSKEKMKIEEQTARDEETKVAELLFLPPKKKKKKENTRLGSRVSRRLLKQQEEKEAAAEMAEAHRRKKLLRSAQKSIMLWDPDGPARKPPRECAELLVSAESIFDLSNSFQRCTSPDFVLSTIGGTTRGAIERAYDWLIPIISRIPDIIGRLPSSTSCFLLLRAYGADGERREQLRELATPLLLHVRDSLIGTFGEAESVQAFDILLSDVGSYHSDRRKSARRVLHDALGQLKTEDDKHGHGSSSWMLNITKVNYASAVVSTVMSHLAAAAKYERGKVLKSIVVALQAHTAFAQRNGIPVAQSFALLLSLLVSQRPNVYAEAIDAFPDFRSLVVKVIYDEVLGEKLHHDIEESELINFVSIKLRKRDGKVEEKLLPVSLLETTCIVLSIWSGVSASKDDDALHIEALVNALMLPSDEKDKSKTSVGLASATNASTSSVAVTVDSWIMLCKARSDSIGKRAALSVPEEFLGRLLLSSGLPKTSLHAMVDRISSLGSASSDVSTAYRNLLLPSASSEWDIGRVGTAEDIARRLLGRLSAYLRAGTLDHASSRSFAEWLHNECRRSPTPTFHHSKKPKSATSNMIEALPVPSSVLSSLQGPTPAGKGENIGPSVDASELDGFISERELHPSVTAASNILEKIELAFFKESPRELHEVLEEYTSKEDEPECSRTDIVLQFCEQIKNLPSKPRWAVTAILYWLPVMSCDANSVELWSTIFAKQGDLVTLFLDELILLCTQAWSETHLRNCAKWIISLDQELLGILSARRLADFLVKTCSLSPPEQPFLADGSSLLDTAPEWGNSEAHASSLVNICILAADEDPGGQHPHLNNRNSVPSWLTLLEMLGNRGKRQLDYATEAILLYQKEHANSPGMPLLDGAILRLYFLQPTRMNLGSSPVRAALLRASVARARTWTHWRSSLDDLLEEAISSLSFVRESNVAASTATSTANLGRLPWSRVLLDHARRHPLLILRKTARFLDILEEDATVPSFDRVSTSSGRIDASPLVGPAEARWMSNSVVRVHIKHWGFSFTEQLWNTVLDIYLNIPKEVLFHSGLQLGFLDLLNCYLRLLSVQMGCLTGEPTARLKTKFAQVLQSLQTANNTAYQAWWSTDAEEGMPVRNLLVGTNLLSPQQAIQSIRSSATK